MKKKILILSIDGGGIRGIIPVKVLQYIEKITGQRVTDIFDLFAGTSTGGLIAAGITVRDPYSEFPKPLYNLEFIENIYLNRSSEIFPLTKFQKWYFRKTWSKLISPRYDDKGFNIILEEMFNNKHESLKKLKITDCIKPILISSYDIVRNKPIFFKTRYANVEDNYNYSLFDVCKATSSAPTYIAPHLIGKKNNKDRQLCIDGGIYNNNPTISVLIEVYKHYSYYFKDWYKSEELAPENVFLLSLGTGRFEKRIKEHNVPFFGKLEWISHIIDFSMWGNSQANDYYAKEIFDFTTKNLNTVNYLRINVDIENEKYADMAYSDNESINYWIESYKNGFENNDELKEKLVTFLNNAGISTLNPTLTL